jgi:peptidoglycan/xylan/chitin deacetylase (PgdA/CDA1 family)
MHRYFIKSPWIVQKIFSSYTWSLPSQNNAVYLTFDDGPHPVITPWVLDELKKYNARATFFCIGKNVVQHPNVYQHILAAGHSVGNHTQHHVNGWKTATDVYLKDVAEAATHIPSNLFRPPYGKIKKAQANGLSEAMQHKNVQVIMWDVLSADFDLSISPEQCYNNVMQHVTPGSVVVFHDSEKAFKNLSYALPRVLQLLSQKGCLLKNI